MSGARNFVRIAKGTQVSASLEGVSSRGLMNELLRARGLFSTPEKIKIPLDKRVFTMLNPSHVSKNMEEQKSEWLRK